MMGAAGNEWRMMARVGLDVAGDPFHFCRLPPESWVATLALMEAERRTKEEADTRSALASIAGVS